MLFAKMSSMSCEIMADAFADLAKEQRVEKRNNCGALSGWVTLP